MIEENLHYMRKEYSPIPLDKEQMEKDPIAQFANWFEDALKYETLEANAMVVATSNRQGEPSVRYVLLKSYSWDGFTFFTNYKSKKGVDIEQNNKVTLLFFWPNTMRQIRIKGVATKTSPQESDLYFNSRPFASQASSALSKQSEILKDKDQFDSSVNQLATSNVKIKRPINWGGYLIKPHSFEFWQGGVGRSHDRFLYTQQATPKSKAQSQKNNNWIINRLYP
ncbi:MAG: pyridoxamine 5'-phosphate oxidase [Bacteroidales bacterium]